MELVLGIDFGTSYFKLGLFDREGRMVGLGREAVEAREPQAGWRELDVETYWSALRRGLGDALEQAGAQAADIRAVSYSSQANTFLLLDDAMQPLTPFLLWTDVRATPVPEEAQRVWNHPRFLAESGQDWQGAEFAIAKFSWLRRERPDLWQRARRAAFICDYLTTTLTGRAAGDAMSLSLTALYNQKRRAWWPEGLETMGLDPAFLPEPLAPGTKIGEATEEGARCLGLAPGTAVAVGSLDHHAAAVGAGLVERDEMSESTGTVVACLHLLDSYQPRSGGLTGPGFEGRGYAQLAFGNNGAVPLEWYQKTHAPEMEIPELLELAAACPPGADGLTARPEAHTTQGFEAFVGHDPTRHGHGARVRAILESTAASLKELVDTLRPDDPPRRFIATGGGARSDLWLQIKADMLGAEFAVPVCVEPGCLGAAMAAAHAAGWFGSIDEAAHAWRAFRKTMKPTPEGREAYVRWLASRPTEASEQTR